ncbi:MAG: 3'-5' exonuclease [Gammaproteobacteria bacterium WSBS_2016_MAG_OTU1]
MSAPILSFDIETIPDVEFLRQKHNLDQSIDAHDVVEMAKRLYRQEKNNDFLSRSCHEVAVISCVLRRFDTSDDKIKIFSLSVPEYEKEEAIITMFFKIMEKYTPKLVSWNGSGFDLPVLNIRALKYGISARRFWQADGSDSSGDNFRWNNYISRYHERHIDVMDVLAMYQPGSWTGLSDAAQLCGLPGKIGIGGSNVWTAWQEGQHEAVRRYCEVDALLTYLLFVRFQHLRGLLSGSIEEEYKIVRDSLDTKVWEEFLSKWPTSD